MWTIIFTALLPSFILSYEVDTKTLNGLAKARVEVSKAFHSASISGRMKDECVQNQDIRLVNRIYMKTLFSQLVYLAICFNQQSSDVSTQCFSLTCNP